MQWPERKNRLEKYLNGSARLELSTRQKNSKGSEKVGLESDDNTHETRENLWITGSTLSSDMPSWSTAYDVFCNLRQGLQSECRGLLAWWDKVVSSSNLLAHTLALVLLASQHMKRFLVLAPQKWRRLVYTTIEKCSVCFHEVFVILKGIRRDYCFSSLAELITSVLYGHENNRVLRVLLVVQAICCSVVFESEFVNFCRLCTVFSLAKSC